MNRSLRITLNRRTRAILLILATALARSATASEGVPNPEPGSNAVHSETPPRSVLEESFRYHRQGNATEKVAHPTVAPSGGWYGYGFPVETHRWGWFGAEHYYPRVLWHRGYYGDRCRWAYRRGY
jgi:hypothetical protein